MEICDLLTILFVYYYMHILEFSFCKHYFFHFFLYISVYLLVNITSRKTYFEQFLDPAT